MCGIVGYVGPREAAAVLVDCLSRLEYRGYDSAGLAVLNGRGVETRKLAGRIDGLRGLLTREPVHGRCGIGHTRWATHGAPTGRNAHPHSDCTGGIALVHNGIIENADLLRARLERAGTRLPTATAAETLAHLIEDAPGATLEARVIAALAHVEGTYGLAVIGEADPGKLVVARRGSPLLIGVGEGEFLVASDANAVLPHTRSVVYLDDGDLAVITDGGYRVFDREARVQDRSVADIEWDLDTLALGEYPHFMLKEICEQAQTVQSTLRGRLPGDRHRQCRGLDDRPGGGRRDLPPCRPRDRRRLDQGLHVAACGAGALRTVPRENAGAAAGRGAAPREAAGSPAGVGEAHARARGGRAVAGPTLRARRPRAVPGAGRQLPGGARGRAQPQGDLLHPRRGLPGGRDEAWAHCADRRKHAGRMRRAPRPRLPEGRL